MEKPKPHYKMRPIKGSINRTSVDGVLPPDLGRSYARRLDSSRLNSPVRTRPMPPLTQTAQASAANRPLRSIIISPPSCIKRLFRAKVERRSLVNR